MSTKKPSSEMISVGPTLVSTYNIQSVQRACDILKCFQQRQSMLSLSDVVDRTGLSRTTAFRLLTTLVEQGMLDRPTKNQYRTFNEPWRKTRYRFGYASQADESSFSKLVSDSIRSQAYEAGVELLEMSSRHSSADGRDAEIFVRERVDIVIEFQTYQQTASVIAAKSIEAGIPVLAIEIPHPGADYYGANNYRAGLLAGHAMADAAVQQWKGVVDDLILLELPSAGPLPRSRLTGVLAGIREVMPKFPDSKVRFINCNGRFDNSLQLARRYLLHNKAKHVMIAGLNDSSCLGALQAFEEAGRSAHCLCIGQNASVEARREIRRPGSRMVGSVAYFPEKYGEAIMALALDKLNGKEVPPATFVRHQLIACDNVDAFYPNDKLMGVGEADSLLYSLH